MKRGFFACLLSKFVRESHVALGYRKEIYWQLDYVVHLVDAERFENKAGKKERACYVRVCVNLKMPLQGYL